MKVTYNQTKGFKETNRSFVENNQRGVYVSSPAEVNGRHNPRKDYATWSYAHEAGHLLNLEDGYYVENKQQKVKSNYKGNEMMTKVFESVKQDDINRLTDKVDCPCPKK